MMKLAKALIGCGNECTPVYRGMRDDSRVESFQFWASSEAYAAEYGEVMAAELNPNADILDLRECLDDNGDYDGEKIDALLPGLADAMGIDADTIVERDRLWDCSSDYHAAAVALVRDAGFDGWLWYEGDEEAYCLFVEPVNALLA